MRWICGLGGRPGEVSSSFLKKKNQQTFALDEVCLRQRAYQTEKSLLLLFFRKAGPPFLAFGDNQEK
jgi:hypothetical protein